MGSLSNEHESLRLLLQENPQTALRLVSLLGADKIPRHDVVEREDGDFSEVKAPQLNADLVLKARLGKEVVLGLVVEVQRTRDKDKLLSWPLYVASLHHRLGCTTGLLVLATSRGVARWASKPIETFQPGSHFAPWVIGPEQIPHIDTLDEARQSIELAVLSAIIHGRQRDGAPVVGAALEASLQLDDRRSTRYTDLILAALGDAAQTILEALMQQENPKYLSDFARKYYGEGEAEGEARGEARGEAKGKAEGLITVLRALGLVVSPALEGKLIALRDLALLERLLVKAVQVDSVDALLEGVDLEAGCDEDGSR